MTEEPTPELSPRDQLAAHLLHQELDQLGRVKVDPPVHRSLVVVRRLRRPADHLAVVGAGHGTAYVVTSASPRETAEALRAIADEIEAPS